MTLRKCPSCKDIVGADSAECPRCGVNFRGAQIRRVILWVIFVLVVSWGISHFVLNIG
jgi:RNA polymerase subunit RPABC4/transcription elongation factor Spt4